MTHCIFWGYFFSETQNIRILDRIGCIINVYKPTPDKAAIIENIPIMSCMRKVR